MAELRFLVFLGILISPFHGLYSLEWRIAPTDSSVLLPEKWDIHDADEPGRVSFLHPDGSVIFQISVYPGEAYESDVTMMNSHLEELEIIESDHSRFVYGNALVSLADTLFLSGDSQVRGWFLFINRDDYDYYLTAITPEGLYSETLPWILSCIDSFSPDEAGRAQPGAISAFFTSDAGSREEVPLEFLGRRFSFPYSRERLEASQLVIEREAFLLNTYRDPVDFAAAWRRYYQLIYRDTASDLAPLTEAIAQSLDGKDEVEKAEIVLEWLQGFEYGSSDSFSDLLAPVSVVVHRKGDCDALGLVYCHLMDRMGIPSLLMVSYIYSHAMAAVGVDRPGAGFTYEDEKKYIVAEMTKKVDLGMISRDMADMTNWIVISPGSPDSRVFSLKE